MSAWQFMSDSPWLTFFLALIAAGVVKAIIYTPFRAFNRLLRHLNVRKAGWPPAHLDADGDWKPEADS